MLRLPVRLSRRLDRRLRHTGIRHRTAAARCIVDPTRGLSGLTFPRSDLLYAFLAACSEHGSPLAQQMTSHLTRTQPRLLIRAELPNAKPHNEGMPSPCCFDRMMKNSNRHCGMSVSSFPLFLFFVDTNKARSTAGGELQGFVTRFWLGHGLAPPTLPRGRVAGCIVVREFGARLSGSLQSWLRHMMEGTDIRLSHERVHGAREWRVTSPGLGRSFSPH